MTTLNKIEFGILIICILICLGYKLFQGVASFKYHRKYGYDVDGFAFDAKRARVRTEEGKIRVIKDKRIENQKLIFKCIKIHTNNGKSSLTLFKNLVASDISVIEKPHPRTDNSKMVSYCQTPEGKEWLEDLGYSVIEDEKIIIISWEKV